jgi:hypothetical protein
MAEETAGQLPWSSSRHPQAALPAERSNFVGCVRAYYQRWRTGADCSVPLADPDRRWHIAALIVHRVRQHAARALGGVRLYGGAHAR